MKRLLIALFVVSSLCAGVRPASAQFSYNLLAWQDPYTEGRQADGKLGSLFVNAWVVGNGFKPIVGIYVGYIVTGLDGKDQYLGDRLVSTGFAVHRPDVCRILRGIGWNWSCNTNANETCFAAPFATGGQSDSCVGVMGLIYTADMPAGRYFTRVIAFHWIPGTDISQQPPPTTWSNPKEFDIQ